MAKKEHDTKQTSVDRRAFMQKATAIAAGTALTARAAEGQVYKSILSATVLGANERIRTGHIGTGGMGRAHLVFLVRRKLQYKKEGHEIAAVCDLWPENMAKGCKIAAHAFEGRYTRHHDFREIIDNKDIDAVVIATPDHWHCLPTLYAADAGKDIYCEKPLSTTIEEGLTMVDAVRRNKVVFQAGTMQRSGAHFLEAVELVRSGHLGPVHRVETFNHESKDLNYLGMGKTNLAEYPGCDWDFHQGWVEHKPFNTNRWIYNFRWFLDYSGGKITDWGAHLIDIALWAMGEEEQPKSVVSVGNKFCMEDNRTTPDTLEAIWEYEDYILSFSNRVYNGYLHEGYSDHGIIFHGTQGSMRLDRGGYEIYNIPNNGGCEPKKFEIESDASVFNFNHWDNFFECVRERKEPVCSVEKINNTTRTCHMGTCSFVADGAKLHWNRETQRFKGDGDEVMKANAWAYRPYQNGWSLKAPFRVG
jgi:predicted dehydrogenase